MNETGRIWVGSKVKSYGKPWVFGQFEECALESALYILEISDLSDGAMSNPVIVSRTFSKMSNSFDDNGILMGLYMYLVVFMAKYESCPTFFGRFGYILFETCIIYSTLKLRADVVVLLPFITLTYHK